MPPVALVDPATFDTSRVIADREAIRQANPQRFEMEQLTAIIHLDPTTHLIIGYKDVEASEFWVRGHMPDYPLMPGVLICEAAAQLASFYCHAINLSEGSIIGFGGMEDVRFRGQVRPGDPLDARFEGQPGPPSPDHLRDPGIRRHQYGLSRPDHRRPFAQERRTRPTPMIDATPYTVEYPTLTPPIAWPDLFGNDHPVELEIGSGKGLFLANAARSRPDHNFFGIEMAKKYARKAADRVAKLALANVRVLPGDAPPVHEQVRPSGQPARRPRLLSRPLVEGPPQEAPGVRRAFDSRPRTNPSSQAGTSRSPPMSRITSVSSAHSWRPTRALNSSPSRRRALPSTTTTI